MLGEPGTGKFDGGQPTNNLLEFCPYPYDVDDATLSAFLGESCIVDHNDEDEMTRHRGVFLHSYGHLFKMQENTFLVSPSSDPNKQDAGRRDIIKKRLEEERKFCERVEKEIKSFVLEAVPKLFAFCGQTPRELKFCVTPSIVRKFYERSHGKYISDYNGIYLSDLDMVVLVTNSLRKEQGKAPSTYDYNRLSIHELIHAISMSEGEESGFARVVEHDGVKDLQNVWSWLNEGMTEMLTRDFFRENYPDKKASFNGSYLKAERLIVALSSMMGGFEQLKTAYFSGHGVETILSVLNSNSKGLVFDEDIFDTLIDVFVNHLSTSQWISLLRGKKLKIGGMFDLHHIERARILDFFPNLSLF